MAGICQLHTGIPGFDLVANGGLPKSRSTLVSGTAGAGKTIFAAQFLAEGIRHSGEHGVFVTLEEKADDIRDAMADFGWDISAWERDGQWAFVDGSTTGAEEESFAGDFDLGGLLARVRAAVDRIEGKRVAVDALTAFFARFTNHSKVRTELFRMGHLLRSMGVTTVVTTERTGEQGEATRYGVEEFVSDNVIILRNTLERDQRYRTIEILKMRGVAHRRGEFPFVVVSGRGIEVVPLHAIPLDHPSPITRCSLGNVELDAMCRGGALQGSTLLVSGPTGSGKTLVAIEFASAEGEDERCLFLGFEESREQLQRNAVSWGLDLARLEAEDRLRMLCEYPSTASLEDRLVRIKDQIVNFRPTRLVVDSLTSLGRVVSEKVLQDFTMGLTAFAKQAEVTTLLTADVGPIVGAAEVSDKNISALTDGIILLRYVELGSEIYRGITVLKMRGTGHEHHIREFTVGADGLKVGAPFQQVHGVLVGSAGPVPTVGRSARKR